MDVEDTILMGSTVGSEECSSITSTILHYMMAELSFDVTYHLGAPLKA